MKTLPPILLTLALMGGCANLKSARCEFVFGPEERAVAQKLAALDTGERARWYKWNSPTVRRRAGRVEMIFWPSTDPGAPEINENAWGIEFDPCTREVLAHYDLRMP